MTGMEVPPPLGRDDMGHAQWVFTIPKILRGYFLRNRELLGDLSRAAWETVRALTVWRGSRVTSPAHR